MIKLNLKAKYPQNYIIQKPAVGTFILFVLCYVFTLLYKPLFTHESYLLNYELTMLSYILPASIQVYFIIILLKRFEFFNSKKDWSILKELIFIYIILQVMGISSFLSAFIIEAPSIETRWNLFTFVGSCENAFLVGIIPFAFFTILNYKYSLKSNNLDEFQCKQSGEINTSININSSLKKENLSFLLNEFLFVTSEGNYCIFYLYKNNKVKKISIRNSISNIETQFVNYPNFFKCHRAYIVNMNKVLTKKGNALGYVLSMSNCENKIPVSRGNVKAFDILFMKRSV